MSTTAKKTAAKKTTASDTQAPEATTTTSGGDSTDATKAQDGATDSGDQAGPQKTTNGLVQNYGPGTSDPVAPPEDSVRPPATIVNTDPAAAPLDPPADQHTQMEPPRGYDRTSTDQTYAEAGGRTIAGEHHYRLVDADGNTLGPDDLFDDNDPIKTTVTTKVEVLEEFCYPNTITPVLRRVFGKGTPVPRAQAERIKAAAKEDADHEAIKSAESSQSAE